MIKIAEIFGPTIQGEGPHAGLKTLFVRVSGCSFKCSWCDSTFTWDTRQSLDYEEETLGNQLIKMCKDNKTSNVILTGGNPCIYDFTTVVEVLHKNNITVEVETQGDLYPQWLKDLDLLVISPKGPSSGMPDTYDKIYEYLSSTPVKKAAIKIPIFNEDDFLFAERYYKMVMQLRAKGVDVDFYLSVGNIDVREEGSIQERILSSYEQLIQRVNNSTMERVFILPQIHTLVWGNKQGV